MVQRTAVLKHRNDHGHSRDIALINSIQLYECLSGYREGQCMQ